MKRQSEADAIKKAKNIAAVLYMLALTFVVGGTYLHQQAMANGDIQSQVSQ